VRVAGEGPPPPRIWSEKNPDAAKRLEGARALLSSLGEELSIPVENLLTPDFLRRLCWEPPQPLTAESVAEALRDRGARPWQIELLAEGLATAFVEAHQPTKP
jgi:ribonuclease D